MAQTMDKADPAFVDALKTNISGIYFRQVEDYTAQEIEVQFRKAVQDPALLADEEFMQNLMFLVRKREVANLHDDVWKIVTGNRLTPPAQVSALKTAFALANEGELGVIDSMEAEAVAVVVQKASPPESSPFVGAADRIGGARTLVALNRLLFDAANRQRTAEQQTPGELARIGQLDKVRAGLQGQAGVLSRKQEILAKPDAHRIADLTRVYMRRSADLKCWAYRLLVEAPTPDSIAVVQQVVSLELPTFLPLSGQSKEEQAKAELDLRLRGIALLEKMGAPLQDEETQLLRDHFQMMQAREPFFYPTCDWEDILDRV